MLLFFCVSNVLIICLWIFALYSKGLFLSSDISVDTHLLLNTSNVLDHYKCMLRIHFHMQIKYCNSVRILIFSTRYTCNLSGVIGTFSHTHDNLSLKSALYMQIILAKDCECVH